MVSNFQRPFSEMREVLNQITAHLKGNEEARFTGAARQDSLLSKEEPNRDKEMEKE